MYEEKEKNRAKEIDTFNYMLGKYVGMGVNASAKHPYPKKPFLQQESMRVMTPEEMERRARRYTVSLGGKINGNNS